MLEGVFASLYGQTITVTAFLIVCVSSLLLGGAIGWSYRKAARSNASMTGALMLLPFLVQIVIVLVNGNLGAGVAVTGAFSLVRFRSAPGTAQDIAAIFLAMTAGLACGMGYVTIAVFATLVVCACILLRGHLAPGGDQDRELRITIPENLDYTELFDDLFQEFTAHADLTQVKTANLGSLYCLCYRVRLRDPRAEKAFLDQIRCRNGNLEIVCGRIPTDKML